MEYKLVKILDVSTTKAGNEIVSALFEFRGYNAQKLIATKSSKEAASKIKALKPGDVIEVDLAKLGIESKEYNGKYYTEVWMYAFEVKQVTQPQKPSQQPEPEPIEDVTGGDLPF